jgi:hypothetical protein
MPTLPAGAGMPTDSAGPAARLAGVAPAPANRPLPWADAFSLPAGCRGSTSRVSLLVRLRELHRH